MTQYNNIADKFRKADEEFTDVTRPLLYSLINAISLKGKKLLDLGCGYGKDLAYFDSKGAESYGIDCSAEILRYAKTICPRGRFWCGSFESLPYEDNFFDSIFSRYAIQHSNNVK